MSRALIDFLETVIPKENILSMEPMKKHTTFRVGGPAEFFVTVDTKKQLSAIIPYLEKAGWNWYLIGNGSNLLVGDKGCKGIILKLSGEFKQVLTKENRIEAGAAALLSEVAQSALTEGLAGFEFAAGIPGTVGGAMVMNAGAYGGEMAHIVELVRVMDREGNILELSCEDMEFGYRTSVIKNRPFIVLETIFRLTFGEKETIRAKMQELAAKRREKQPLEYPSAGSTFKRPEGYFAGKLIMDAGLAGSSLGGAQVSEKHCGFIINKGDATAADIAGLIERTKDTVAGQFGVRLEPEVIFLGDF